MTTNNIKVGDIIEVDKRGRRFYAKVRAVGVDVAPGAALEFQAISHGVSYRTCTSREVVGHYRASKATRVNKGLVAA
jgi:hypothetical protein